MREHAHDVHSHCCRENPSLPLSLTHSPIRLYTAAENKGNNNQLPSSERSGSADAFEKKEATWEYIRVVNMAEYDTLIDLTTVRSLTHTHGHGYMYYTAARWTTSCNKLAIERGADVRLHHGFVLARPILSA